MIDLVERWRRRVRRSVDRHRWGSAKANGPGTDTTSGTQGVLLIQIDGLGFDELGQACESGLMPNLARLRAGEPYRLAPLYAGVPSSTPAFQAELFYGCEGAVPAYGFVHRKTGRVFRMSDRDAASTIEAGLNGRGLLDGGSSYGNIYRGGAAVTRFSMATLGYGDLFQASRPRHLPRVVLAHGFDAVRATAFAGAELLVGVPQLLEAVRKGQPFGEELRFLQARIGVSVVLREALATLAIIDMTRGLPVIHLDLLGYDEWAHRRGPGSDDALRALRGIDRVIGRLVRGARRSDARHYDVFVFSDHGQERTEPYESIHGRLVGEAIGEVLARHGIEHETSPEPREGVQGQRAMMLGSRLAEAIVPGLELRPRWWDPQKATTTAFGPLGHIYLPEPLTDEQRSAMATDLVDRADVPMILAPDGNRSAIAWTAGGTRRLPDEAAAILGSDHPYLDEAARDLVGICHHPDAGELVMSGWRLSGPPVSFTHENGSHAGPGPRETRAFVCAPADTALDWDGATPLRAGDLRRAALHLLEGAANRPVDRWGRQHDGTTLRLVTYNVHSCIGLDGTLSPERIARVIARIEPDVVALQELDVGRSQTGGIDQAEAIARHLGMIVHFHPTYAVAEEQFGDAILSRLPMRVVRTGSLPQLDGHPELEPRGAVQVEIDAGDVTYTVINTHLSVHPRERRLQVEALIGPEWLGGVPSDAHLVLCGDFNAGPGFPTCRSIGRYLTDVQIGLDGHRPRRTWGGRWPLARIDHIFIDDSLDILHVEVPHTHLTRTASDHLPLFADLRVERRRKQRSIQPAKKL